MPQMRLSRARRSSINIDRHGTSKVTRVGRFRVYAGVGGASTIYVQHLGESGIGEAPLYQLTTAVVQQLGNFREVDHARAVVVSEDGRDVHFEVCLAAGVLSERTLRRKLRKVVTRAEWQMRRATTEEWYFSLTLLEDGRHSLEDSSVIAAYSGPSQSAPTTSGA